MKSCFTQIAIGLVLTVLDLRIGGLDLLPDFVGYVLVGLGAGSLAGTARGFLAAAVLALVLGVASLVGFFVPLSAHVPVWLGLLAVHLAMVWVLFGGFAAFFRLRQAESAFASARRLRLAYSALAVVSAGVSLALPARDAGFVSAATIVLTLAELVVVALLVRLVWTARRLV